MKLHIYVYTYVRICRVIWVNNKLLAGRKCDISVCTADIFKHRDYLVRGKSVFSYCGIILLTRPDYTFSRRATFSPDAFINCFMCFSPDSSDRVEGRLVDVLNGAELVIVVSARAGGGVVVVRSKPSIINIDILPLAHSTFSYNR